MLCSENFTTRQLQAANWDPYRASTGIVYIDEVDKISRRGGGIGADGTRDVGGEGVQQSLLRIMEGSVVGIQAKGSPPEGSGPPRPGSRGASMVNREMLPLGYMESPP